MSAIRITALVVTAALVSGTGVVTAKSLLKQGTDLLQGLTKSAPGAATGGATGVEGLTESEIGSGLRSALDVATKTVVEQLGQNDGYNADPAIHIPLPDSMKQVQSTMQRFGMAGMLDDLELKLNRAAEQAAPQARQLFVDAIAQMTMDDARAILNGPDDAATKYFQQTMSDPLADEMRPIVDRTLAETGAIAAYDQAMGQYRTIPLVPDVKADLTEHVVGLGLDGIFHYVAAEEAAIRKDPIKRTNDILKKVFGAT